MAADRVRRRAGFAVAVGVGAAIACGTASPAWASEDGPSTTGDQTASTSSETGEPQPTRAKHRAESRREADHDDASDASDAEDSPASADDLTTDIDVSEDSETQENRSDASPVTVLTPVETDEVTIDDTIPEAPTATPALWSLLGSAPREKHNVAADQPVPPATTSELLAGQADSPSSQTPATTRLHEPAEWESLYTGEPSWFHNVVTAGLNVLKVIFKPFGGLLRYTSLKIPIFTDGVPPFFVRPGLDVERTEFEGMKVWSLTPREGSTEKVIVALHGGSYEGEVNLFQWSTYAVMARDTGATVVVPLYTLAPKGTAATEVPRTANFVSKLVSDHGAGNVSVLGDSAGGGLALAALQELARRTSQQPSRLVLMAPWLDVSMSDPRSAEIKDPLLDIPNLARPGGQWAGTAGTADPTASPLFGSLQGLPPTYVYSSSRDLLTVDTLRLRDRVLAEAIPDVTFRLRAGLIHDWFIFPFLPDARAERPNVYADLLGSPVAAPAFLATK